MIITTKKKGAFKTSNADRRKSEESVGYVKTNRRDPKKIAIMAMKKKGGFKTSSVDRRKSEENVGCAKMNRRDSGKDRGDDVNVKDAVAMQHCCEPNRSTVMKASYD